MKTDNTEITYEYKQYSCQELHSINGLAVSSSSQKVTSDKGTMNTVSKTRIHPIYSSSLKYEMNTEQKTCRKTFSKTESVHQYSVKRNANTQTSTKQFILKTSQQYGQRKQNTVFRIHSIEGLSVSDSSKKIARIRKKPNIYSLKKGIEHRNTQQQAERMK
jgi:hypothetical protein